MTCQKLKDSTVMFLYNMGSTLNETYACVKRGEKNGRLYLIGKKSKCVLVLTKKKSVYLRYTFEAGVRTTAVYSRNLAYLDCLVFAVTKRDFIMLQEKHKNKNVCC